VGQTQEVYMMLDVAWQYVKYLMVGGIGAGINWVVLYTLFEIIHLPLFISFLSGAILASVFNFILNRQWTFEVGK